MHILEINPELHQEFVAWTDGNAKIYSEVWDLLAEEPELLDALDFSQLALLAAIPLAEVPSSLWSN